METAILDVMKNGVFITDLELTVHFWNEWMVTQTGIEKADIVGKRLDEFWPEMSFKKIRRKIRIALRLNSSSFVNAKVEGYALPIEQSKITKSIFKYMRQDVVITPFENGQVSVIITDASPLLEAEAVINDQLLQLERLAKIDTLTQCYNRAMFNELLRVEKSKAERYGTGFSLIIFDIDNFKSVNDTYGHLEGDKVLRELAAISTKHVRQSDFLARWGGEEFCILLPETDLSGAAIAANNLRIAIAKHDFGKTKHQYCSFGVASYFRDATEDLLIEKADKALYHAKNNGKNQVAVFRVDNVETRFPAV